MSTFDVLRVRAAYDEQVRRSQAADGTGAVVEAAGGAVRWEAVDGYGWSGITWSDLDDGNADDAIAA